MPNIYQGSAVDPGLFDSIFDAVGNIGSIFGQLLFVTFWLSIFLIGAGALFLIWLNVRHAKECDVQDSQETRTEDLLRELAPAAQRFSIVDGRAVQFDGEIPDFQESAADQHPDDIQPDQPIEILIDLPGRQVQAKSVLPPTDATSPAAANVSSGPVDDKLKYAPPGGTSNPEK